MPFNLKMYLNLLIGKIHVISDRLHEQLEQTRIRVSPGPRNKSL